MELAGNRQDDVEFVLKLMDAYYADNPENHSKFQSFRHDVRTYPIDVILSLSR